VVTAEQRRTAVRVAQETALQFGAPLSERRACRLLDVPRATHRYVLRRPTHAALRERLRALALERPRWGYRRLAVLLTREGHRVNHKLVHRLYREEGLVVRRRRKKRTAVARTPLAAPTRPNERWSLDFVSDALADGRKFRALNIVDAFTRECLVIEVDTSLPGERVVRVLERLRAVRSLPESITVDNGPELAGKVMDQWAYAAGVTLDFITPGKPVENAYIESFNGKFRDECLNQHWFVSLADARFHIERFRIDYNEVRPHSSLENQTPAQFAEAFCTPASSFTPNPGLSSRVA
jgi:putative transposase